MMTTHWRKKGNTPRNLCESHYRLLRESWVRSDSYLGLHIEGFSPPTAKCFWKPELPCSDLRIAMHKRWHRRWAFLDPRSGSVVCSCPGCHELSCHDRGGKVWCSICAENVCASVHSCLWSLFQSMEICQRIVGSGAMRTRALNVYPS